MSVLNNLVTNLLDLAGLSLEKRIKLTVADGVPQADFIYSVISDWAGSPKLKSIITGLKYYENKNDIKDRKRYMINKDGQKIEVTNLANSKLPHPFMRKLTNQKISYFLSKPFTIKTENVEFERELKSYFSKNFFRMLESIGTDAICCGVGWLQVYYDEKGKLCFKRIPVQEIIPFWADADHTKLDAIIRVYEVKEYNGKLKTSVKRVEYYTNKGVYKYKLDGKGLIAESEGPEGHFSVVEVKDGQEVTKAAVWDNLPFIAFKYNKDELGLINLIKELIDDYDLNTSDTSNVIQDTPNSVKVIKDYDGENKEEFIHNLSLYRVVFVGQDGGIDKIDTPVQVDAVDSHLNRLRKDIFEFGGGIDTQNKELRDASGVALRFLYSDLDMDCASLINQFSAALEKLIWFICIDIETQKGINYQDTKYEIIFNTDIIVNENDTINNLAISQPFISRDTILANHPYVTDPKAEMIKLEADQQRKMKEAEQLAKINLINKPQSKS